MLLFSVACDPFCSLFQLSSSNTLFLSILTSEFLPHLEVLSLCIILSTFLASSSIKLLGFSVMPRRMCRYGGAMFLVSTSRIGYQRIFFYFVWPFITFYNFFTSACRDPNNLNCNSPCFQFAFSFLKSRQGFFSCCPRKPVQIRKKCIVILEEDFACILISATKISPNLVAN